MLTSILGLVGAVAAVKAAPGFVQDSLDTVAELEDQIKELKVK